MPTFIVVVAILVFGTLIAFYEHLKIQALIAKAVDGVHVEGDHVSEQCKNLIAELKEKTSLKMKRFSNTIVTKSGHEISYLTDSLENFITYSNLKFEPTSLEWQILRQVVKKVINH